MTDHCTESEKQNGRLGAGWLEVYQFFTLVITWLTGSGGCHCPTSWRRLHIASLGKDQNSKLQVWFLLNAYCFPTIIKLNISTQTIVSWGPPVHYDYMHAESRFSRVWLFATLWTIASQAPLSMGFSRQEYWSGLPCPPPGDLPDSGIEPASPALASRFFTAEPPGKPCLFTHHLWLFSLHWKSWVVANENIQPTE